MSVTRKVLFGAGWMLAGNASTQVMAFLINVLLARILLPEDFGSVALVSSFLAILQVLGEMGLSVAIVQKEDLSDIDLNSAFILNVTATIIICVAIFLSSRFVADFFSNGELQYLFKLAAFSYLFRGLYSFCNCILLRGLSYRSVAILNFVGVLASGFFSVFLALRGFGASSVVWGQVAASFSMFIFGWKLIDFRPQNKWSIVSAKELLSFGLWVSLNRLLNNIAGKIDAMIIGRSIGSTELGQYYLAQRLVLVLPSLFSGMLDQVLLPVYSRLQGDPARVERSYWDSLLVSSIVTVAPVCLIFLLAPGIVNLLYGEKWLPMVPIMRIVAIFAFAGCFGGGIFGSVMYAQGKTKAMSIVSLFRIIALPVCLLGGSLYGVKGVAWGFALYGIIGRLFNQCLLSFFVGYSFRRFLSLTVKVAFPSIAVTFFAFIFMDYMNVFLNNGTIGALVFLYVMVACFWSASYVFIVIALNFRDIKSLLHRRRC